MKTLTTTIILAVFISAASYAQDTVQSSSSPGSMRDIKYLITGDAFFGFKYINDSKKGNTATFTTMGFNPIFLYKLSDKLFFESEVEFQTSLWQEDPEKTSGNAVGEGLAVELETADLTFAINKYMMVKAGIFFTAYGVFEDWYHQRITNRMVSRPIGIGHGGIEPGSDAGISLRGGIPLGSTKLHYAIDVLNGGKLISDDPSNNNGNLDYESIIDNNTNKAVVVRIGFLPVSWLEFGGWFGKQKVGASKDSLNKNVGATHSGAYFSIIKDIDPIKGTVCFRSQYSMLSIGDATFKQTDTTTYIFKNNNSSAYYAQLSYRPTMLRSRFFKRLEIAARYGSITLPDQAQGKWIMPQTTSPAKSRTQWAFTLDYWLKWNVVIKLSYEQNYPVAVNGVKPPLPPATFLLQVAMGL